MMPASAFADENVITVHSGKVIKEKVSSPSAEITYGEPYVEDPTVAELLDSKSILTISNRGIYYSMELKIKGLRAGVTNIVLGNGSVTVVVQDHIGGESKVEKEPNCIEPGIKSVICSECGEEMPKVEIPALGDAGHIPGKAVKENIVDSTYEETGTCDSVVYCSVCGKELERTSEILPVKVRSTSITSLKSAKARQAVIKWKTKEDVDGYQIYLSKSSKFKSDATTKSLIKSNETGSKKYAKLSSGKTYYFKVRAYKIIDDKKVYSKWSSVKKIKVK